MRTLLSLLLFSLSLFPPLACGAPEEPPGGAEAALDRQPPPAPSATGTVLVDPATCVGAYIPMICTCPNGFVPGPGYCVKSANPLDECNSANDCQTVRGNPAKCHAWSCGKAYPPPDDYDACMSLPVTDERACSATGGVPGTCGLGDSAGDCVPLPPP